MLTHLTKSHFFNVSISLMKFLTLSCLTESQKTLDIMFSAKVYKLSFGKIKGTKTKERGGEKDAFIFSYSFLEVFSCKFINSLEIILIRKED